MDTSATAVPSEVLDHSQSSDWKLQDKLESTSSTFFQGPQAPMFFLNVTPQKDSNPETKDRPVIPASNVEKFAYLRAYVTSKTTHTMQMLVPQKSFNKFFWTYLPHVFFRTLPNAYISIFYACYAPNFYLYFEKMSAVFKGINFVYIISSFLELLAMVYLIKDLTVVIFIGITEDFPWNRCPNTQMHVNISYASDTKRYSCVTVTEAKHNVSRNYTPFMKGLYFTDEHNAIVLSQAYWYYSTNTGRFKVNQMLYVDTLAIWIVAAIQYKVLFCKRIWRVFNILQLMLNASLLAIVMHIVLQTTVNIEDMSKYFPKTVGFPDQLLVDDIYIITDKFSVPPVLHILVARGTQEAQLDPNSGSAVLTINNALYHILRWSILYVLELYLGSYIGVPLNPGLHNELVLLLIYFSTFELGNACANVFWIVMFTHEFIVFTITFHILIETVICEWKFEKRILVTCAFCFVAFVLQIPPVIRDWVRMNFFAIYLHSVILPVIVEIVILYLFYPFSKMLDDIIFHTGVYPPFLMICDLVIYPFYCVIKMSNVYTSYIFYYNYFKKTYEGYTDRDLLMWYHMTSLLILYAPVVIGAIYTIIVYVKKKKSWTTIFGSVPEWGPPNFYLRQLRKLFDSRTFLLSQAWPRQLSRHILERREQSCYEIDIDYGVEVPSAVLHIQNEVARNRMRVDAIVKRFMKAKNRLEVASKIKLS